MNKFKIGDKVEIINRGSPYYECKAIIRDISRFNYDTYYCDILTKRNNTVLISLWIDEHNLKQSKEIKNESFTISIRKHKRLNLNFKL